MNTLNKIFRHNIEKEKGITVFSNQAVFDYNSSVLIKMTITAFSDKLCKKK